MIRLPRIYAYAVLGQHRITPILECFEDEAPKGISVYFEPEGAEHQLMPDDQFRVECYPPAGERIEIAHHRDGISLQIGDAWGVRAFRLDGTELQL